MSRTPRSDDLHSQASGQQPPAEEPLAATSPTLSHAGIAISDRQQAETVTAGYDATVLSVANTERSPQPVAEPSDSSRDNTGEPPAHNSTGVDSSQRQYVGGSRSETRSQTRPTESETPADPVAPDTSLTRSEQTDKDSRPRLTFKQPATPTHETASSTHTDSHVDQPSQPRTQSTAAGSRSDTHRSAQQDQSARRESVRGNQMTQERSMTDSDPFEPVERPDRQPESNDGQMPLRRSTDRRQNTDQRSHSDPTLDPTSAESLAYDADVDRLVETLYRRLERKMKIEREQRGF